MTTCPKCGNKAALDIQHMIFFPEASKVESDRKNYGGSHCQMCGHKWNKYHKSEQTSIEGNKDG